jgi:hypothetical protein
MSCKFLGVSPDNLFFDGLRILFQWSVTQKKVMGGYGENESGTIYLMVKTSDKKCLFVSGDNRC